MSSSTFAVVGCGRIGQRHLEMIRNVRGAQLVATCDVKSAEELGLKSEVPHYRSLEELLAAHRVDVVAIASPNGLHAEHALTALNAHAHVIIEKPMALRKADAERVEKANAEQRQLQLQIEEEERKRKKEEERKRKAGK